MRFGWRAGVVAVAGLLALNVTLAAAAPSSDAGGALAPASLETPATGATGASVQPSAAWLAPYPGPTPSLAYLAHVVVSATARAAPSLSAPTVEDIGTTSLFVHGPVQLLVLGSAIDSGGRIWLRVRLPTRPNNASGWILAGEVTISRTGWRIVVELAARRLEAFHDGRLIRRFGVVIGNPATPTPTGLFAVYALARQPAGSELGPWALHLTAHSDVLENYGGGPGRVAVHGRAGPLLAAPIGSAASHGCIRADNPNIGWLAAVIPLGTPVIVER